MTGIRMACDLLLADGSLDANAQRSVQRIQAASRDMLALVEAFLILARVGDTGLPDEDFSVNDIVREEVEKRSEEHTSELQSLMRISYAVFCLKQKKDNRNAYKNTR